MSASASKKLSLVSAIFINLNVMIGTGIFVNTYLLSARAGAAGFLLYPLVGLCMLPLIAITGRLLNYYPTGGLYAFAKEHSAYLGFLSCWSYFFAKLASCALMLFVATTLFQQLIPGATAINPLMMCLGLLSFFTFLNLLNMKLGMVIHSFFLTAKSIPIIFAIISGFLLFDTSGITTSSFVFSGMIINIPLVLYCLAGFETACSLSRNIENPSVNGPKAVYYSFGIIMALYGLFQGLIYMSTYEQLASLTSYQEIFPSIAHTLFSSEFIANKLSIILSFAIGSSALGGAYGILFSNSWNLYTLAENNHLIGSSVITKLNQHNTPYVAVLTEAIICAMFLLFNQGSQLPLQRTAALGIVIAYTISALSYFLLLKKVGGSRKDFIISTAAFVTCTIFVTNCMVSFCETGLAPLLLFIGILVIGSCMFMYKQRTK